MSRIIAGIYEINEQIGAGGGGIVYLGRHIRLDKKVVLKADKRSLKADEKTLRREVDLLKELTQTYIPKVYDFVEEDGIVYTVMDYIDGESLDKLIKRKQLPSQPQIIKWACQLLEALDYLHSQPPHGILHADIKPANIMLRTNGDVCLIDYNIALALGEDGAVKVGYSKGYASPEHYSSTFTSFNFSEGNDHKDDSYEKTEIIGSGSADDGTELLNTSENKDKTEIISGESDKTELIDSKSGSYAGIKLPEEKSGSLNVYSSGGTRMVKLDARSDIYSLGATLYHLISGVRPAEQADGVKPLGSDVCSPAVAAIINKAMQRRPDDRYQSASEMLLAFRGLYKNDPRTIRRKKKIVAASVVASAILITGGALTFVGLRQLAQRQNALALSEYSANALDNGDVEEAIRYAMEAIPSGSILDAPITSNARNALTNALGVYDLEDSFRAKGVITLPAEPFHITKSKSGRYVCFTYAYEAAVYDLNCLENPVALLPLQNSALSDVVFIDDVNLIFAGDKGVSAYSISSNSVLWQKEIATNLSLSLDGKRVAAINRDEDKVVIYDTATGDIVNERKLLGHLKVAANDIFADPDDELFALNDNGNLLAITLSDGSLTIMDMANPENDIIIYEKSDYDHFDGGFVDNVLSFSANGGQGSVMMAVDTIAASSVLSYDTDRSIKLSTSQDGIYVAENGLLVHFDSESFKQSEVFYNTDSEIAAFDVSSDYSIACFADKSFGIYDRASDLCYHDTLDDSADFCVLTDGFALVGSRSNPTVRVLELQNHTDADICEYDANFKHDEARISADGMTALLFDINGFKIFDKKGNVLSSVELENSDTIYDQQFIRQDNNSFLEVTWYDGTVKDYDAGNGSVLKEYNVEPPSKDLYEEFATSNYRIESDLHEAATVYDINSGKEIARLKSEDFLTYITETSEGIIAQYMTSEGDKYGILLDDTFEQIAYLPGLCDVYKDNLIFDYGVGKLRQSRLFSLRELKDLGDEYE